MKSKLFFSAALGALMMHMGTEAYNLSKSIECGNRVAEATYDPNYLFSSIVIFDKHPGYSQALFFHEYNYYACRLNLPTYLPAK